MRLNFQQGVVTYPRTGPLQSFLVKTGFYVTLQTSNGQTDVAFAHGESDYLLTEAADVANAWGPIPVSTDTWLFWDIDLQSAVRTFGITLLQPLYGIPVLTAGYREVEFGVAGYQAIQSNIAKTAADIAIVSAGTYYFRVATNGGVTIEYSVLLAGSTTFAALATSLDTAYALGSVVWDDANDQFIFTSDLEGPGSSVSLVRPSVTLPDLFATIESDSGIVLTIQTAVPGTLTSKTITDSTGLTNDATVYTATILINGAFTYPVSVVGSSAQTIGALIAEIQADVSAATVALVGGKIRITSNSPGDGSAVFISDTDLFSSLTNFVNITPGVVGTSIVTFPVAPVSGQHFFDTTEKKMYIFELGNWREVIRAFAAKVNNITFTPLGSGFPSTPFAGTQVNILGTVNAGRIIVDDDAEPIRRVNGEFFTTESDFFINGSPVNTIRLEANVLSATALTPIGAFQVVQLTDFGRIEIATYNDLQTTLIAMLMEALNTNETGTIITQGTITNPAWNFTTPGAELWIDGLGAFTEDDPHVLDPGTYPIGKPPIARVITPTTIFFDQGLGGKGDTGVPGSATAAGLATNNAFGIAKLSLAAFNALNPIVAGDNDPRLSDARLPLPHVQAATTITFTPYGALTGPNVQLALQQVEDNKIDASGAAMTGFLTLNGNPSDPLHAVTKQYVDALTLQALADVTLIVPSIGDVLVYNGLAWTNQSGGGGEPTNYIVFGTGTGTDSDADFQWDPITNILTLNGQIQGSDGSCAMPTYSFINDTNSGLYLDLGVSVGLSWNGCASTVSVGDIITLTANNGDFIQIGASIIASADTFFRVNTNSTERLEITSTGEWEIGGTVGTAGYVITSAGPGSPPAWAPGGGGGASEPANQIVYGTGAGIGSDPDLLYFNTIGAFYVNSTSGTSSSVSVASPGAVGIFGASASGALTGGEVILTTGSSVSGRGGALRFSTGSGPTGDGNIIMHPDTFGGYAEPGAGEGAVQITGGTNGTGATGGTVEILGGIGTSFGGNVLVFAGSGAGTQGGSVILSGGTGPTLGANISVNGGTATPGSIRFTTNTSPRLEILGSGGWEVGGTQGTAGFVLTSNGAGTPPTWQAGGGGPTPYDIGGMVSDMPAASAIVLNHVAVRTISFADDFAGSFAVAQIAATASTVFVVNRNGAPIGTITFAAAATTGTFVTTLAAESLTPGQVLTVVAPVTPDATLADIAITFFGTV